MSNDKRDNGHETDKGTDTLNLSDDMADLGLPNDGDGDDDVANDDIEEEDGLDIDPDDLADKFEDMEDDFSTDIDDAEIDDVEMERAFDIYWQDVEDKEDMLRWLDQELENIEDTDDFLELERLFDSLMSDLKNILTELDNIREITIDRIVDEIAARTDQRKPPIRNELEDYADENDDQKELPSKKKLIKESDYQIGDFIVQFNENIERRQYRDRTIDKDTYKWSFNIDGVDIVLEFANSGSDDSFAFYSQDMLIQSLERKLASDTEAEKLQIAPQSFATDDDSIEMNPTTERIIEEECRQGGGGWLDFINEWLDRKAEEYLITGARLEALDRVVNRIETSILYTDPTDAYHRQGIGYLKLPDTDPENVDAEKIDPDDLPDDAVICVRFGVISSILDEVAATRQGLHAELSERNLIAGERGVHYTSDGVKFTTWKLDVDANPRDVIDPVEDDDPVGYDDAITPAGETAAADGGPGEIGEPLGGGENE